MFLELEACLSLILEKNACYACALANQSAPGAIVQLFILRSYNAELKWHDDVRTNRVRCHKYLLAEEKKK